MMLSRRWRGRAEAEKGKTFWVADFGGQKISGLIMRVFTSSC